MLVIKKFTYIPLDAKKAAVHGKISFSGKKLTSIPDKSCMVLKIEDALIADAPSTVIARKTIMQQDLKLRAGFLLYNITFQQPEGSVEYTLGATLNLGWCPSGDGNWVHGGDFLTTSMFTLEVKPEIHLYEKDIELEYNPGSKLTEYLNSIPGGKFLLCFYFISLSHLLHMSSSAPVLATQGEWVMGLIF